MSKYQPRSNVKMKGKLFTQCCNAINKKKLNEAKIIEFINNQEDLEPEIKQVLQDNLWDLYSTNKDDTK